MQGNWSYNTTYKGEILRYKLINPRELVYSYKGKEYLIECHPLCFEKSIFDHIEKLSKN